MSELKVTIESPKTAERDLTAKPARSWLGRRPSWRTFPNRSWRSRTSGLPKQYPRCAMQGRSADEYRAPLFVAWQLTNRCKASLHRLLRGIRSRTKPGAMSSRAMRRSTSPMRIIASADSVCRVRRRRAARRAPLLGTLRAACRKPVSSLKLETDGSRIDDVAADRLAALAVAMRADLGRWRDGSDARARAAGIELRRGDRGD